MSEPEHPAESPDSDQPAGEEWTPRGPAPVRGFVEPADAERRAAATRDAGGRPCRYCGGALPPGKRADARDCSDDHRNRFNRERRTAPAAREAGERRLEQAAAALGPLTAQLAELAGGLRTDLEGAVAEALTEAAAARADAVAARRAQDQAEAAAELATRRAAAAADAQTAAEQAQRRAERAADRKIAEAEERAQDAWTAAGRHQQARQAAEAQAAAAAELNELAQAAHAVIAEQLSTVHQERDAARAELAALTERHHQALTQADTDRQRLEDELRRIRADAEQARAAAAATDQRAADLQQQLNMQRQAAAERQTELQARIERAERLADQAERRAEQAEQRAEQIERRAEQRAVEQHAQHTAVVAALREALRLPEIEDLDGAPGVPVGDTGAVLLHEGQITAIRLPEIYTGDQALQTARALLAVHAHRHR
ncbi:hypothetical protein ACIBF1_18255 [Spirillospora sp. NPDC050679]